MVSRMTYITCKRLVWWLGGLDAIKQGMLLMCHYYLHKKPFMAAHWFLDDWHWNRPWLLDPIWKGLLYWIISSMPFTWHDTVKYHRSWTCKKSFSRMIKGMLRMMNGRMKGVSETNTKLAISFFLASFFSHTVIFKISHGKPLKILLAHQAILMCTQNIIWKLLSLPHTHTIEVTIQNTSKCETKP